MKSAVKVQTIFLSLMLAIFLPAINCHAQQPDSENVYAQKISADKPIESAASTTEQNFLERHVVSLLVVLGLVVAVALSYRWTNTPHGRLHYLAAVSLKLFTFELKYKPDAELDFRLPLPINLIFVFAGLVPKERVAKIRDISIPCAEGDIPARVYWPKSSADAESLLPVIVYYHGGGFVLGSVKLFDIQTRSLANATKMIVVSVDYRLAPRHPYPAAVNDCYTALQWVAENASSLGGDAARLMVAGDSAGANLATVSALRARDENGPSITAQILYYPLTDWASEDYESIRNYGNDYGLTMEEMHGFRDAYIGHLDDYSDPYISPLRATRLAGLPPALIITAGFDLLTGAAVAYARRLESEGVAVTQVEYSNMIHGFMAIPMFSERRDALNKVGQFVQEFN